MSRVLKAEQVLLTVLTCLVALPAQRSLAVSFTGVNLAGAEFGETNLPGTYGLNNTYFYPTAAELNYFAGKGMNTFRVPFRWERMQPTLGPNVPLDPTELGRLNQVVSAATAAGDYVVLDPHNYARYWVGGAPSGTQTLIASAGAVTYTDFGRFWKLLANEYKGNDHVIFNLMNEPNTMATEQWRDAAQTAINDIRSTGATNLILVPGNAWTGAHSWTENWYGTPNGNVMLTITDPANNFAFDVHQYLDSDSSGTTSTVMSTTVGRDRLVAFTDWLHANNRRGFLGEFAVANSTIGASGSQIGDEAINNMLNYVDANRDVWLGWTWWAAGPKWGNYMFTLEPTNLGQPTQADRAAMSVLQSHLAIPGDYDGNRTVDSADYVFWRKTFNQNVTNGTGADGDGNGVIQLADYDIWRANVGRVTANGAASASATSIPEPATGMLALLIAMFILNKVRRANRFRS